MFNNMKNFDKIMAKKEIDFKIDQIKEQSLKDQNKIKNKKKEFNIKDYENEMLVLTIYDVLINE
jgi:hypothetical protein